MFKFLIVYKKRCSDVFRGIKREGTLGRNGWKRIGSIGRVRSSRLGVFYKKDVLWNFTRFTGKHLGQSPFFNKVEGLKPTTLLKRDPGTDVFLWILGNFSVHLFLKNTSSGSFWRLRLLAFSESLKYKKT